MKLDTILDALGGDAPVAQAMRCGVSAISNWKARGIPRGRMFDLLKMAAKKEVALTVEDLEDANAEIVSPAAAVQQDERVG